MLFKKCLCVSFSGQGLGIFSDFTTSFSEKVETKANFLLLIHSSKIQIPEIFQIERCKEVVEELC